MPSARIALSAVEIVEHVISFQWFCEQAAPVAAVCTSTKHILAEQLREHNHDVQIKEQHQGELSIEELEKTQVADAIGYGWAIGAIGIGRRIHDDRN